MVARDRTMKRPMRRRKRPPAGRANSALAALATACCLALGGCAQEIGIASQPAAGAPKDAQSLGAFTRFPH